jgi:hypothetical protein
MLIESAFRLQSGCGEAPTPTNEPTLMSEICALV